MCYSVPVVYKTLIPAESASSDLAERILLHLRFTFANTLGQERGKFSSYSVWENLEFGFDWSNFDVDRRRRFCSQSWLAWFWAAALVVVAFFLWESMIVLFFSAVCIGLTAYGHVAESRRIRIKVHSGEFKPDMVDQVIAGVLDPCEIYRQVIFPWRQLFIELEEDNIEGRVALFAMNLDWFSTEPRFLLRWSWMALILGILFGIAGIVLGIATGSFTLGFIAVLAGGQIGLCAFAACSWRRRVLLGMVISHIEQNYIGNPVEEFEN